MSDLENAKARLDKHKIALYKDGKLYTSDKRGVAPMLEFIESNVNLHGFSAADVVVGKAAAMLFAKVGIVSVYAKTISRPALEFLCKCNIDVSYDTLADNIINRDKTDICSMEKTVRSKYGRRGQGFLREKRKSPLTECR